MPEDFYEDDEDPEKVFSTFDRAPKGITKTSASMLVPQEIIDDCAMNLVDWLTSPLLHQAKFVSPPSRREKLRRRIMAFRKGMAARAYRRIAGCDIEDDYGAEY